MEIPHPIVSDGLSVSSSFRSCLRPYRWFLDCDGDRLPAIPTIVIDCADCVDWGGIGNWWSEMSVDCDPASRRDYIIIIFCVQVPDRPLWEILDFS